MGCRIGPSVAPGRPVLQVQDAGSVHALKSYVSYKVLLTPICQGEEAEAGEGSVTLVAQPVTHRGGIHTCIQVCKLFLSTHSSLMAESIHSPANQSFTHSLILQASARNPQGAIPRPGHCVCSTEGKAWHSCLSACYSDMRTAKCWGAESPGWLQGD